MRSNKIAVHVSRLPGGATPKHDYCRLSFRYSFFLQTDFLRFCNRSGGQAEFFPLLERALTYKAWIPKPTAAKVACLLFEHYPSPCKNDKKYDFFSYLPSKVPVKKEMRAGITGIQKNMSKKNKADQANISKAFQDLDVLINMAKPMVALSKSISTKIRDKQGGITEDETVQFKSYLLRFAHESTSNKS